jgi:signal transduction histidine kinase
LSVPGKLAQRVKGASASRAKALRPEPLPSQLTLWAKTDQEKPGPLTCSYAALDRCLAELVQCYRHSAVGRRLTGIVHLMNSPLQVLSFQLELLDQKSLEELESWQHSPASLAENWRSCHDFRQQKLEEFRQELETLQGLARRLLLQGIHEESQEKICLNLNRICQSELELYQADPFFKHRVRKVFSFQGDLPPIQGYYIDFSQSFRNLIDNALEAMAGAARRVLTVKTAYEEGERLLLIGDTGVGIAPEDLPRVFEPCFTTKGTPDKPRAGLGLFMAQRLLAPYQGRLQIYSRPGQTWVTVRLPVVPEGEESNS